MTTLQTADGTLLRATRPGGANLTMGLPTAFPPMWSDGERHGDRGVMASFTSLYLSQPAVAGVIDKLAHRLSSLPFDAYRHLDNNAREMVRGDSLDSLIRKPMPRWSTLDLNHFVAQSLLVQGNALLAKVRSTGDPEAPPDMLWPLDWNFVNAYAPIGGRIEWWSTHQFNGEERFIAVDDTVHFAWESPGSQIGVSPLQKLRVTLRIEDAAQRFQTANFRNGARPGGVLTLPPGTMPDRKALELTRATLEQMHQGPDNAGRVGLVAAGAEWKQMGGSAVDVALIEQRRLDWEEVGMVFDMGGPLMNDFRHGTYSNVKELQRALYRDVLPPWLSLIEQTWQSQILDPEPAWLDRFVAFDLTDKTKGDPVELAQTLKLQVESGIITRNEARRLLNMAPDPDPVADKLTYNANNQAPIDYHRNTEVLTESPSGHEVNPPAAMPPPATPPPPRGN